VQVFQASHMVGFDVPVVAHDMMLRFMNVDFTKLIDGSVRIPSAVGDDFKPTIDLNGGGDGSTDSNGAHVPTAAEEKARWDAYYNAGTAALVFVLIILAIGLFFYLRSKQSRKATSNGGAYGKVNGDAEESIPLNRSHADIEESRRRKGKGRATEADYKDEAETMFEIGSDGDEQYPS
jgi:carboxypeptidase D